MKIYVHMKAYVDIWSKLINNCQKLEKNQSLPTAEWINILLSNLKCDKLLRNKEE